mmetsp:Transcript_36529/g.91969  ORF Transcript_36529/g.91969 Transcript_36529/m.91969 type:complete len:134 (-) Transcript_36529:2858-3259(-)
MVLQEIHTQQRLPLCNKEISLDRSRLPPLLPRGSKQHGYHKANAWMIAMVTEHALPSMVLWLASVMMAGLGKHVTCQVAHKTAADRECVSWADACATKAGKGRAARRGVAQMIAPESASASKALASAPPVSEA